MLKCPEHSWLIRFFQTINQWVVTFLHIFAQQHFTQKRNQGKCEYQRAHQRETHCKSQRRKHFSFYFLESKNWNERRNDDQFRKENRLAHFDGYLFNETHFRNMLEPLFTHFMLLVRKEYEHTFHHHHSTVYNNSEVNGTNRKKVG